jgi:hypothetical protein
MAKVIQAYRPIDAPKPKELSPDQVVRGIKQLRVTGGDSR